MRERARFGAGHGSEVNYVFNTLNSRRATEEITTEEIELARIMNAYWTNFAKTGNPNGEDLPVWPIYNTHKEDILDIEPSGKPVGKPDPRKARFDVIDKASHIREQLQSRGI